MIIHYYLLIPPLLLSVDASSIRGRNNKNELVTDPREDGLEKSSSSSNNNNNLKVVSNEPFIIQLHVPKQNDSRPTAEKDTKRKRPSKKRVSKLRKKQHRTRRDLTIPRSKHTREEKSHPSGISLPATPAEGKNTTKNSVARVEILKALSSHPNKRQTKRSDPESPSADRNTTKKSKPKTHGETAIVKMIYPRTPKIDRHSHKYTYKDMMADRKRLEQKINYLKNMLAPNDTAADDTVRIRRRSDSSDRTANKIAKMFLTLSAVNGLQDKRKSKCRGDEDEDDRVQDVWEKERESQNRKASSLNAERYKVKKWIEFMKNKRSSGKTCPCMGNVYGDDSDAFPLEQKLPKDYFLAEKSRSSEESSETYRDPYYYSRDKSNRDYRRRYNKGPETQENKLKALAKTGKKKLDLPLTDLELYRSRAKQILQNAEDILDKIKEEEEKRLAAPSLLKELTSRIQGDPRNNENDLIRKIQKSLGWKPLAKSKDESEGNTFVDNVKSFILDPYEKAKALTDESTKMLSTYLLRNLGKVQDSSEEQGARQADGDAQDNQKVYFGQVPTKEDEKPMPASLSKEDAPSDLLSKSKQELQNWEDTISTIMQGPEDTLQKELELRQRQEEIFKTRMEDIIKEQQKILDNYETSGPSEEGDREIDSADGRHPEGKSRKPGIKFAKPERDPPRGLPTRLKQKDDHEKDKTDKLKNLGHLKGHKKPETSKIPPTKIPKPERDGPGGLASRLKPKDGLENEKDKPDKLKNPIWSHLKPPKSAKGSKDPLQKGLKGSLGRKNDPNQTEGSVFPEETEELDREIVDELRKTMNEQDPQTDSVAMEQEGTDSQTGERLKNDDAEGRVRQNEDETPVQAILGEGEQDVDKDDAVELRQPTLLQEEEDEQQQRADGMSPGRQNDDRPETDVSAALDSLTGSGKPLGNQRETGMEEPESDLSVPSDLPDYEFLPGGEEEDERTGDDLKETVGEAREGFGDSSDEESLLQKSETERNGKKLDPENESAEENVEEVFDPLVENAGQLPGEGTGKASDSGNVPMEDNLEEVLDPLLQEGEQMEDNLEDKVSAKDPNEYNKEPVETEPIVQDANQKTESELTRERLENLKSNEDETEDDAEEINLKSAQQEVDDETGERDADDVRATNEKDSTESEEEGVGQSKSRTETDSQADDTPVNAKNSEERPDEKVKTAFGDEDEDEESPEIDDDAALQATKSEGQANDSLEDGEETVKEALEEKDGEEDDGDETPLRISLGKKEEGGEGPVREALGSKEDDDGDETSLRNALGNNGEDGNETPLGEAMGKKDGVEEDDETPVREALGKKDGDDDGDETSLRNALGNKGEDGNDDDEDETPLREALGQKGGEDDDDGDETPLRKALGSKEEEESDDDESPLRKAFGSKGEEENDDDVESPLEKKDGDAYNDETPLRKALGNKGKKEDDDETPLKKSLGRKGEESDKDDENALGKKDEDDDGTPLRKALGNKGKKENDDDETPLRKAFGSKGDEESDEDDESPLEKKDGDDNDDETPLRRVLADKGKKESDDDGDETPLKKSFGRKGEESDEDDESPLEKTYANDKYGDDKSRLRNKGNDDDETPLRKTLGSRGEENDDESPLEKKDGDDDDDDDDETSLRKALGDKEEEDDETPLRAASKKDGEDEIPLGEALKNEEEGDDDDDESPLRETLKNKEENDDDEVPLTKASENKDENPLRKILKGQDRDPLKKALKNKDDETPLRKALGSRGEESDDESPLEKKDGEDDDETSLRKALGDKEGEEENDDERIAMGKEDGEDEAPLREALKSKEEENDDDEIPLRKALKGNDDETPLRETLKSQEDDDENPLRKALGNKDAESLLREPPKSKEENDEGENPLGKAFKGKGDDPLRKTLKSKEEDDGNENVSRESLKNQEDDDDTLRETLKSQEDNDDETPLRETLKSQEDNDDETPLRKTLKSKEEEDDNENLSRQKNKDDDTLRETLKSQDDDDEETPLRETLNSQEDDEDETPLRETLNSQDENPLKKILNGKNDDPLRKALKNKEDDNDDETLREALKSEEQEDENDNDDDETPLREALGSTEDKEEDDDGTLRAENPTEESDSLSSRNHDQTIPKSQLEESSQSEENDDPSLKQTMKDQTNSDPENVGEISEKEATSEENVSRPEEENELQDTQTPLRATLNEGNVDDPALETSNPKQDVKDSDDPEEHLESVNLIEGKQENGDETSEEVAMNKQNDDNDNPETGDETLQKSAENEDPENQTDGVRVANPRAENPDDENLEKAQGSTNPLREDKARQGSQSEENSVEKSGEALRTALEDLEDDTEEVEDYEENDETYLKSENSNGGNKSSEEDDDEREMENKGGPLRATLEEVEGGRQHPKEATSSEEENALGAVFDPEDDKTRQNGDDTQIKPEVQPVSKARDDDLLRSASHENELDSKMDTETPLKSVQDIGEAQDPDFGSVESEETVRAEDRNDDSSEESENVQSAIPEDSNEDSFETLREYNPFGENLILLTTEGSLNGDDSSENDRPSASFPDVLRLPPGGRTGKFKVPKSIGQIMADLDGREKGDGTGLGHLDPDKIDDMIGKIGQAERQNLQLDSPQVDCRKECACADDIDTRSRNIGRYEIVKDFLHWMKDLQLNRVLTDD